MIYQGKMDSECIKLCDAINLLEPDLYTINSCCGHRTRSFRIFFKVKNLNKLPNILYYFDK